MKVLVGLSGGVDSAVTAHLLLQQGYEVTAGFMINYMTDSPDCTTKADLEEAKKVAEFLGIKLYTFDFRKEYEERIVRYIIEGYRSGITPNPDVLCNSDIKFRLFLDEAIGLGFDYIAMGHYARITNSKLHDEGVITPTLKDLSAEGPTKNRKNGVLTVAEDGSNMEHGERLGNVGEDRYKLLKGVDPEKDQSYFLSRLDQEQLSRSIFPLGGMLKSEVRAIAKAIGLPNADRKDSQGICFIGKVDMYEFLKQQIPVKEGDIVDTSGKVLGKHEGAFGYTIGQRQGLKVAYSEPLFVVKKDVVNNVITVGTASDAALYSKELLATDRHRIGEAYPLPLHASAKIRYRQADQDATILSMENGKWKIRFAEEQRAVSSGQIVAIYQGDELVGSGLIQ